MLKAQHESFNGHLMWAPKTADTCMCFGYQYSVLEIQRNLPKIVHGYFNMLLKLYPTIVGSLGSLSSIFLVVFLRKIQVESYQIKYYA